MATFRITNKFNQQARGWSEQYYTSQSTMDVTLGFLDTFLPLRAEILAKDVTWFSTVVQQVDPLGITPKRIGNTDTYPTSGLPGDNTATGILLKMKTALKNSRSMCMRGFPDAWIVRGSDSGHLRMTDAGKVALDAYLAAWMDFGLYVRYRPRLSVANPGLIVQQLLLAAGNTANVMIAHEAPDTPFVAGDKIQFMKGKGRATILNGLWTVIQAVSNVRSVIAFPFNRVSGYDATALLNARVRLHVLQYTPVTSLKRFDVRSRKSGRAFGVPKGRNANRAF